METIHLQYLFRRIKCHSQGHPNKLLTNFSAITTLYIVIQLHNQVATQGLVLGTIAFTDPAKYAKVACAQSVQVWTHTLGILHCLS